MTRTENANAAKTSTINFPDWVKVTKCTTLSYTYITPTKHGIITRTYAMPMWKIENALQS
jgi:hypothetical protein